MLFRSINAATGVITWTPAAGVTSASITVEATGKQAAEVVDALTTLIDTRFGEED